RAAEIAACVAAARDAGALGVSFFEWNHATAEEWRALAALPVVGPQPARAGPYVVSIVPTLNLRQAPLLTAPVIEQLAGGTRLVLRGYHISWAAVAAPDGRVGYVCRWYIRAVLPAAATRASHAVGAPLP